MNAKGIPQITRINADKGNGSLLVTLDIKVAVLSFKILEDNQ